MKNNYAINPDQSEALEDPDYRLQSKNRVKRAMGEQRSLDLAAAPGPPPRVMFHTAHQ
jgi:hypothetical protein